MLRTILGAILAVTPLAAASQTLETSTLIETIAKVEPLM